MPQDNMAAFAQLWCRLLFEDKYIPARVDAVYLHGLSEGMVASCSLFDLVANFVGSGKAGFAVFNGSDGRGMLPQDKPGAAWPGSDWYRRELSMRGVKPVQLVSTRSGLHTRDECDALVELAKEQGWKFIAEVTPPYHWPRVIACLVGAMAGMSYKPLVYFLRPQTVRWYQPLIGSQGLDKGSTFMCEAGQEVVRLFNYWDNGRENYAWRRAWGAPPEEIFSYLDWRDGA